MAKIRYHKNRPLPPDDEAELRLSQRLRPTARLVRFTTLGGGTVCLFDKDKNLLCIDQVNYDQLCAEDQTRVFRSRESMEITHKGNNPVPVPT